LQGELSIASSPFNPLLLYFVLILLTVKGALFLWHSALYLWTLYLFLQHLAANFNI
jgi:hypothetical protein